MALRIPAIAIGFQLTIFISNPPKLQRIAVRMRKNIAWFLLNFANIIHHYTRKVNYLNMKRVIHFSHFNSTQSFLYHLKNLMILLMNYQISNYEYDMMKNSRKKEGVMR
jgi:hypothetical protein